MKKTLSTLLILLAGATFGMSTAMAQSTATTPKKTVKKSAKKAAAKAPAVVDEEEAEPETTGSTSSDYTCELGNKLTIYKNVNDDKHIALRWHNRLHRMTRVDTTTGANRFENHRYNLVWIGIPAKGILLDSKKGQQLANECKNPEQSHPM